MIIKQFTHELPTSIIFITGNPGCFAIIAIVRCSKVLFSLAVNVLMFNGCFRQQS